MRYRATVGRSLRRLSVSLCISVGLVLTGCAAYAPKIVVDQTGVRNTAPPTPSTINAFNENNVLSVFTQISPDSLTAGNFGISNAGGLGELNTFRAVFAGGLTNQIQQGLANGTIARDARFNQPLTRQLPRQVRFGFRFVF